MGNIFGDIGRGLGLIDSPAPPPLNPADVIKDPATGLYVNKRTGVVSVDPNGQQTLVNPTLAQQAARNIAVSNSLLGNLPGSNANFAGTQQQQQGLVGDLNGVISGQGPSVAIAGLQQQQGDIARQQQSQASGATGQNAALARQQAMQNTAMAQAKASQDASLIRAGEIARAREQKGNVLSGMATENTARYGTDVNGALNASGQAGTVESTERKIGSDEDANRKKLAGNVLQGFGSAITGTATGKP